MKTNEIESDKMQWERRYVPYVYAVSILSFTLLLSCASGTKQESKFPNGQLEERFYLNKAGKKDGPYTKWYWNGKIHEKCTYKDGKLHGTNTYWYDNGQKSIECTYKNGKE